MRQRIRHTEPSLHYDAGALVMNTPYDPGFLAEFKTVIPAADRSWDGANKVWLVAPSHGERVADLIERYYGTRLTVPATNGGAAAPTIEILDVRYIGTTKMRDDGTETAFGWSGGSWSVIFPKRVLMEWFGQEAKPGESQTLYGILGVKPTANEGEIKSAWRRLARQWHPDVCREPDAREQFERIQEAYDLLKDDSKRARYDAGLKLEASLAQADRMRVFDVRVQAAGYRSPLRCGYVLAEGRRILGRFNVTKILGWEDIVNGAGQTLVTSWAAGADHFTESWV